VGEDPVSTQHERKLAADRELRENRWDVFNRDRLTCVALAFGTAPWPCSGGLTIQHRRNRGAGGSHAVNGPQWLVAMCSGHNGLLESDAEFAALGRALGWKLEEGEDPLEVAVFYNDERAWRLLDAEGHATRTTGRDPADREMWKGPQK
jgi:hypothetical protein